MKNKLLLFAAFLVWILAACSAAEPQMIASQPLERAPIAVYPLDPPAGPLPPVVYSARIELRVGNVERAAEEAADSAYKNGGYLVSSQAWYAQDDELHKTLVLAVPVDRFETARSEMVSLGSLISEQVFGEIQPLQGHSRGDPWPTYSQITLNLEPKGWSLPEVDLPELRPARTFVQAWGVFTAIFGFLLDVAIWILVVIGPFVLLGWSVARFLKWQRK